jgi:translation initiation factor IF-1
MGANDRRNALGGPSALAFDEVIPGEAGCDADQSEHDRTGNHSGPKTRFGYDWFRPHHAAPPCGTAASAKRIALPGASYRASRTTPEGVRIPPPRRRRGGGKKRREPLTPVIKEDTLSLVGRVVETFPSSTFKVELENGHTILASLAGRLRRFRIRITPGDDVDVELSPYDLTRGRITYRRQGRNA